MLEDFLNTPVGAGRVLGDYVGLEIVARVLGDLLSAILIIVLALFISSWVSRRIRNIGGRNRHLDETLFKFLGNVVRYAILAFAVLMIMNTFGIRTTSLVAAIGAAGLAIGLALQGTLSSVAAGVMIIIFRPIKVGDFIVVNDQMGSVKDITLNYIEMANLQNVQVIVPNSQVWGNTIVNYSAYPDRRIEWIFGVSYGANLGLAQKVIMDTILSDPRARTEPEPFIQVNNLGDFSVDFQVRVWCANADAYGFQTDMTRKVKEALDAAGVEIPFPTRTVYRHDSAPEQPSQERVAAQDQAPPAGTP